MLFKIKLIFMASWDTKKNDSLQNKRSAQQACG